MATRVCCGAMKQNLAHRVVDCSGPHKNQKYDLVHSNLFTTNLNIVTMESVANYVK